jgi:beta-galactosidase/beta-glucuronidase
MFLRVQPCDAAPAQKGNVVKVIGTKGNWQLTVNDEIFRIKGVGVGRAVGKSGADHLKMAKDMGANTVRTWGVNQGTRQYLDTAQKYGLKVDAGIWLNAVVTGSKDSYLDKRYLAKMRKEILKYVRKYKDHPAILIWNIGNEVIFFTKNEEERVAFCRFLESVIQEVHKIDQNHPVVYTSAGLNDVAYLKKYVPSLDLVGINTYGGIDKIHQDLTEMFDIPYLMTEFGSLGEWDRSKDPHGISF